MAEELKLFKIRLSPFALRVEHALKIKGLEYESVLEDLINKSPSLLENNPVYKKIPVLVHNGRPICESLVILEYIDETWKRSPLLPQDPYEKAMARFWAKFGDEKVMRSIWRVFITQGKEREEAMAQLVENLKFFEEQLKGKKFFGGETIGYLDLVLGRMIDLRVLEEMTDLKLVDKERFPLLYVWMNTFAEDPLVKEIWPTRDESAEKFKAMLEPYLKKAA